jgi:N-acylneuraminate cytidylyltransferase
MNPLFLIPARSGSKGLPGKNKKLLNGKPLIAYSIEYALKYTGPENICISTDDIEILELAKEYGINTPFVRPDHLASDTASSFDVMLHAIEYFEKKANDYDTLVLLQVTSPFRQEESLRNAFDAYTEGVEAVLSVCKAKANPYYVLFEENEEGYLRKSKELEVKRRQDAPTVYEVNGSIYVLNIEALKKYSSLSRFNRIVKVEMPQLYSVDIDDINDWNYCEFILEKDLLNQK